MNKDKLALRLKVIFYFLLGVALPISTAFALDQIEAKNVSFNPKNGLASTNMEDAIDEVYQKVKDSCPDDKICIDKHIPVTGVSLNKTSGELYVNLQPNQKPSIDLSATISPSNATNKKITWRSDNPNIATVDGSGHVKAVNSGQTTIRVYTDDGNKTASFNVTVRKRIIIVIGASQVTRMANYKTGYTSNSYNYNTSNGTLVYVNEAGTGMAWQYDNGLKIAKSTIDDYSNAKNYTSFYIFYPLSGNGIKNFDCGNINESDSQINSYVEGYAKSIADLNNEGYNAKGYVVSMHPVNVNQRGSNKYIVLNNDKNACSDQYRSNYKYYKFSNVIEKLIEKKNTDMLKFEPLFKQVMNVPSEGIVEYTFKINYNTTDGMHWDSDTTNTYVNMMLNYYGEL